MTLPAEAVERFRCDVRRLTDTAIEAARDGDRLRLALAVSGGPDSMAMLALAAEAFPGRVVVATVDHRLRTAAADEARMVASWCEAYGIAHRTLAPDGAIQGNIQSAARRVRYALLSDWARQAEADVLLTAHHADDQAETLLMRLNRASGIAGLSAIRTVRRGDAVPVLRPLLSWRRAELRALVEAAGVPFVDDPSNDDDRFDRVRMRAVLARATDLDAAALATSAVYLAEAEEIVDQTAHTLWRDRWHGSDKGFRIEDQPRELRRRLVRRAILAVRLDQAIVRPRFTESSNVEPLLDALEAGKSAVQGGVLATPGERGVTFRPAPPRRA